MQSSPYIALSLLQFKLSFSSILCFFLIARSPHHCANCPQKGSSCKGLSMDSISWTLHLQIHHSLLPFTAAFGDEISIFTHSMTSPPFIFSSLLNLTALLTQLKRAPAWPLLGCLGASSSDHLISVHPTWSLSSIWQSEPLLHLEKFFFLSLSSFTSCLIDGFFLALLGCLFLCCLLLTVGAPQDSSL